MLKDEAHLRRKLARWMLAGVEAIDDHLAAQAAAGAVGHEAVEASKQC
jgi:hypothetical protein